MPDTNKIEIVIPPKLWKFEGHKLADGTWVVDTWSFDPDWDKRRKRFHQRGLGESPVAALTHALRKDK